MQTLTEPKIIAGNSNMTLASAITRRMSMHRGKLLEVVDARIERFNDKKFSSKFMRMSGGKICLSFSPLLTRQMIT